MPNYLDFLDALDLYVSASPSGEVSNGFEMHTIAQQTGLATPQNPQAAYWVGQLIDDGYVVHGVPRPGDRPPPPRAGWTDVDLQRFNRYGVTPTGRAEAARRRQQGREAATDAVLGATFPVLSAEWLDESQRAALAAQVRSMRDALDAERWADAIGAAKNLVESAAGILLVRAGRPAPTGRPSLPSLVKEACSSVTDAESDLARRLTSTVHAIAEARNASDAAHGRPARVLVEAAEARLASAASCAISQYLLSLP